MLKSTCSCPTVKRRIGRVHVPCSGLVSVLGFPGCLHSINGIKIVLLDLNVFRSMQPKGWGRNTGLQCQCYVLIAIPQNLRQLTEPGSSASATEQGTQEHSPQQPPPPPLCSWQHCSKRELMPSMLVMRSVGTEAAFVPCPLS